MSSFLELSEKCFSNFGRGIGWENKNCIKVSKIFMGMGNVIVKSKSFHQH